MIVRVSILIKYLSRAANCKLLDRGYDWTLQQAPYSDLDLDLERDRERDRDLDLDCLASSLCSSWCSCSLAPFSFSSLGGDFSLLGERERDLLPERERERERDLDLERERERLLERLLRLPLLPRDLDLDLDLERDSDLLRRRRWGGVSGRP